VVDGLPGGRKNGHPKDECLRDFRQTKELARFSLVVSFWSEHLASFSESQLDACLPGTSRPIRTVPVSLVLLHLSFCNVFMLFIVLIDLCRFLTA